MVEELGVKAVGISGKDGAMLKVEKKYSDGKDIGFVGDVKEVDPKVIYDLLENDFWFPQFSHVHVKLTVATSF